MKKLPIGRDNLKDIIEGDFYYVDKTGMIEELLNRGSYITLFPRPKRFGKSLMISTIEEYFDVEKSESNKNLFNGLHIKNTQYSDLQGTYPVIKLNFKSLKSDDWEHMYDVLQIEFQNLYNSKLYLYDSLNENEKAFFDRIWGRKGTKGDYEIAIQNLSKYMQNYYNKKVILLIDEYDVPIQCGYNKGFYNDVIGFIKNLFGNTLKTNNSVWFAVMTGVLRVSKESIFSDLNNVDVYTAVDNSYEKYV